METDHDLLPRSQKLETLELSTNVPIVTYYFPTFQSYIQEICLYIYFKYTVFLKSIYFTEYSIFNDFH